MNSVLSKRIYKFGLFEADVESGKLLREGVRVKLQEQPFRVLCLLLDRAGEVVSREDLRQALWSADTYVEFDGSLNAALKRLRYALGDSADNPVYIETLPRRGYRFLAPVTVREPPQNTVEPLKSPAETQPSGQPERLAFPPIPGAQKNWRRMAGVSFACIILVFLVVASYHRLTTADEPRRVQVAQPRPITLRRSVAVLGFTNSSGHGEDAWLSTALSEMLSTELAAGKDLRMISSEDVSRMKLELPWKDAGSLAEDTATRIYKILGSDLLVLGSYTVLEAPGGRKLRLDLRLQEANTGEILTESSETGSSNDLFDLASRSGAKLRERLGIAQISQVDLASVRAALPEDAKAARLYAEGLDKIRSFDATGARDLLERAVALDPSYPLSHAALAESWSLLGYEVKAKDEARVALENSASLQPKDRLSIEGRYRQSSKEWPRAVEVYRTLFDFFPDDIDLGLDLASVLVYASKSKEALAVVQQLRQLPPPLKDDPRIDLVATQALVALGQYKDGRQAAIDAVAKATSGGTKLLEAQADFRLGTVLIGLGQLNEARDAAEKAQQIYQSVRDPFGVARALSVVGSAQWWQGDYAAASTTFKQALSINTDLGNDYASALDWDYMGSIHSSQGEVTEAKKAFEQALALRHRVGDVVGAAATLSEVAGATRDMGDLPEALKLYGEALTTNRAMSDIASEENSLLGMLPLLISRGEWAKAEEVDQQITRLVNQSGDRKIAAYAQWYWSAVAEQKDQLEKAQSELTAASSLAEAVGNKSLVAEILFHSAEVDEELGRPGEAEARVREARAEFQKDSNRSDETLADALLVNILLDENKVEEASREIAAARALVPQDDILEDRLALEIASGRVQAASGSLTEAAATLTRATAQAREHGYLDYQMRARLAWGEMEARRNPRAARTYLEALRKQAESKGFVLIARKAGASVNHLAASP